MAVQNQIDAQESEPLAGLNEAYNAVDEAADTAYRDVAEEVERFFSSTVDQKSGILDYGHVDVEIYDGDPVVRYRGEIPVGAPEDGKTQMHRYALLDETAWDTHLQDVYAPLQVAAHYLQQVEERSDVLAHTVEDIRSHLESSEPDEDTAEFVLDTVQSLVSDTEDAPVSRHVAYPGTTQSQ